VTGQQVSFALVGEQSFTYKAQAPGTAGTYTSQDREGPSPVI
jgi:hypothetical protein